MCATNLASLQFSSHHELYQLPPFYPIYSVHALSLFLLQLVWYLLHSPKWPQTHSNPSVSDP